MENLINRCCQECGTNVDRLPTLVEYKGQEIFLFDPVICKNCLRNLCDQFSVRCQNCGGSIPPSSPVGVLKAANGQREFVHINTTSPPVATDFSVYLVNGHPHPFIEI